MIKYGRYVVIGFICLFSITLILDKLIDLTDTEQLTFTNNHTQKKVSRQLKVQRHPIIYADLYEWIYKPVNELEKVHGAPLRKDLSAFGYTWWLYTDGESNYIQFGVSDDIIKTVYATGNSLTLDEIRVGQDYEVVRENLSFKEQITYQNGASFYTFQLTDNDLQSTPLIKVTDDLFIQCYFDTINQQLSSIRLLTGDILLLHRPYEAIYRGVWPDVPSLTEDQWVLVQEGMANQVYYLTNIKRVANNLLPLIWDEEISAVAFSHSVDMNKNNYFSHYSLNGDGLEERLDANKIIYLAAGENIAAQHPDGPAAIEGWLNSQTHREALLSERYTHLGVGVYRHHFTQNFVAKFE